MKKTEQTIEFFFRMICYMSVICHLPTTLIEICEIKQDLVRWDIYPAQVAHRHNTIERNRI